MNGPMPLPGGANEGSGMMIPLLICCCSSISSSIGGFLMKDKIAAMLGGKKKRVTATKAVSGGGAAASASAARARASQRRAARARASASRRRASGARRRQMAARRRASASRRRRAAGARKRMMAARRRRAARMGRKIRRRGLFGRRKRRRGRGFRKSRRIGRGRGRFGRRRFRCFAPETPVKLQDGNEVAMKNLKLGDILINGSIVEATLKIRNEHDPYYKLQSSNMDQPILVTGSHYIKDGSTYKHVSKFSKAEATTQIDEVVYCLVTNDHKIPVGDFVFWDWEDNLVPTQLQRTTKVMTLRNRNKNTTGL